MSPETLSAVRRPFSPLRKCIATVALSGSLPDKLRTAEHLAASQVPRLSLPAHDYDDLPARWSLDDTALDTLQRHKLLYDRDGTGEFHHLYTGTFHDRFFFEVIQRRGTYAGFAAANASVRAVAQARQHPATTDLL